MAEPFVFVEAGSEIEYLVSLEDVPESGSTPRDWDVLEVPKMPNFIAPPAMVHSLQPMKVTSIHGVENASSKQTIFGSLPHITYTPPKAANISGMDTKPELQVSLLRPLQHSHNLIDAKRSQNAAIGLKSVLTKTVTASQLSELVDTYSLSMSPETVERLYFIFTELLLPADLDKIRESKSAFPMGSLESQVKCFLSIPKFLIKIRILNLYFNLIPIISNNLQELSKLIATGVNEILQSTKLRFLLKSFLIVLNNHQNSKFDFFEISKIIEMRNVRTHQRMTLLTEAIELAKLQSNWSSDGLRKELVHVQILGKRCDLKIELNQTRTQLTDMRGLIQTEFQEGFGIFENILDKISINLNILNEIQNNLEKLKSFLLIENSIKILSDILDII